MRLRQAKMIDHQSRIRVARRQFAGLIETPGAGNIHRQRVLCRRSQDAVDGGVGRVGRFEREVTGERIRDKIATSKKKGMWMGGVPPLGYAVREHRLVVIAAEAETVLFVVNKVTVVSALRPARQSASSSSLPGHFIGPRC